jgi:sialate O-acetylesterase
MKTIIRALGVVLLMTCFAAFAPGQQAAPSGQLRLHAIFDSDMVLQRGKPITIWGWAAPGAAVAVQLGSDKADAQADGDKGRWQVTFPAREASAEPQTLTVTSAAEKVEMGNIVVGDVWVMYGQSNMAFPLAKVTHHDTESAQANLPTLRLFSIKTNEQADLQENIRPEAIATGWVVSTPETALEFSAIGYVFGAQLQRSLGIPIGVIASARGGASMEGLVPFRKFHETPAAKALADSITARRATFDLRAEALRVWKIQTERAKSKGVPEDKWPKEPQHAENVPSWNIPGMSPAHPGSVYNGMFGVFKGYNIKGVLFHHGHNNAMVRQGLRPQFYRWMMKAMMEGIREDFNDPQIAFGVIGFCAGDSPQTAENFEARAAMGPPFIREAQRLGVADMNDPANIGYIPAHDVQVAGLHPTKKREHGLRAARWALNRIYGKKVQWDEAKLLSVQIQGDIITLTYDKRVHRDDSGAILEGFSVAGEDGKFYMAYARNSTQGSFWDAAKIIHVWSPLVPKPVALRYAWGHSPMGNLKVHGHPDMPLPEFRTDSWDLPENEDLLVESITSEFAKQWSEDGKARLEERLLKESQMANEIRDRLQKLSTTPTSQTPPASNNE